MPIDRTDLEGELERLHPASFSWALNCCGRNREVADRLLDPLLQRHVGGPAALAAAPEANIDVVLADVDQLDEAAVLGDGGVDLPVQKVGNRPLQVPL